MIHIRCLQCKYHLEVEKIPSQCPVCTNDFHPLAGEDSIISILYETVTKNSTKGFCYCDEYGWTTDEAFRLDEEDEVRPYEIEDPYSFL